MVRFLKSQISDQPQSNPHSSPSSSPNSSLASQSSLPSVPSLTPPPTAAATSTTINHHCLTTIKSTSSSSISSLSLSGKHLFSGDADGMITSHDRHPQNCNPTPTPTPTSSAVKSILPSFDHKNNRIFFTAHQDNKIRVWDGSSNRNKLVTALPTLTDRWARLFSPSNYVEIRRNKKRTWVHHVDAVSSLAITNDSSLLYSASWDRSFKVWRTDDYRCVESVRKAHDDAINAVALSNDGFVYTGSADRRIRVWKRGDRGANRHKHVLVSTLEEHRSAVNALALSEDGSRMYSGACDRSIVVWEREGGGGGAHMGVVGALRGHGKAILCLAVVKGLVMSGSADKTVRVWRRRGDGNGYSCVAVLEGHRSGVKCLTACLDGDGGDGDCSYLVYSGSLDGEIKVWKICVPFE